MSRHRNNYNKYKDPYKLDSYKKEPACYLSHPTMSLENGIVAGGSCYFPAPGYDIYIGLDKQMAHMASFPWEEPNGVIDVHYPITDMDVPKDPESFKRMNEWVRNRLRDGKKVHFGCIGGHGRTGMALCALVSQCMDEKDAIAYVRKHYCDRVVETAGQSTFLKQHFGITMAQGGYKVPATNDYSSYVGSRCYTPLMASAMRIWTD